MSGTADPGPTLGVITPLTPEPFSDMEQRALSDCIRGGRVDAIWVRDLPAVPREDPDTGQGHDPFAHVAHLAGRRLLPPLVGTASVIVGTRHPLVIARAAVGAQQQTAGRFVLGLGTGGKPAMSAALGVTDRPKHVLREEWFQIRAALRGEVGEGLRFVLPPAYEPPPMYLASADPRSWEAIDGQAEGWLAFVVEEEDFVADGERIAAFCDIAPKVAARLDLRLDDDAASPMPPIVRGAVTCTPRQLGDLLKRWRSMPVDHLLVRLSGPTPTYDLQVLLDLWDELS